MPRPAVFLDRDGVLNVYLPGDYVKSPAELRLLPGIGKAVRRVNEADIPVFVISNQQGVAKGLMSDADLAAVDAALHEGLKAEGGHIEKSYYCPHASSALCECRKPQAGMLLQAARENDLDLSRSVFIGDTETDAQAARTAGVKAFVLVLTGKHIDPAVASNLDRFPIPPDYTAADLSEAVDWALGQIIPAA